MADKSSEGATVPDVPIVYANDVYVDIGATEISLTFREDFDLGGEAVSRNRVRVVMTHDVFTRLVDFLEKRAKLFRRVYTNRPPNLYAGDMEELRMAFAELYPPSDGATSDEDVPNPD